MLESVSLSKTSQEMKIHSLYHRIAQNRGNDYNEDVLFGSKARTGGTPLYGMCGGIGYGRVFEVLDP